MSFTQRTIRNLSCDLKKKISDSNYKLHFELRNETALDIKVVMTEVVDLENFINTSTFLSNLLIDGHAATRFISFECENGFIKWKATENNRSRFNLIDDRLEIQIISEASDSPSRTLNASFKNAYSSRHEVAQLITEIDQHFGISDEDKLKIQTFCHISLPVKSILDIAKSGNHAEAYEFAYRSYDFPLKLELVRYFGKETNNTVITRQCCELVFCDKRLYGLQDHGKVIREVADFYMLDRGNELFETYNDRLIEYALNHKYIGYLAKTLFDCFIKASMYDQALKCASYFSKGSIDYNDAQHALGMLLSEHSQKPELSYQEQKVMKEKMLTHFLEAPKYEEEFDKIYASLCADNTRDPVVKKVGLTVGTLFNTAEQIKRKNQEINQLKAEICRLKNGNS